MDRRVGLCVSCQHVREITSDRGARFYLCQAAKEHPSLRKYPALPVFSCTGYAPSAG